LDVCGLDKHGAAKNEVTRVCERRSIAPTYRQYFCIGEAMNGVDSLLSVARSVSSETEILVKSAVVRDRHLVGRFCASLRMDSRLLDRSATHHGQVDFGRRSGKWIVCRNFIQSIWDSIGGFIIGVALTPERGVLS
jgi:hypothetical protein